MSLSDTIEEALKMREDLKAKGLPKAELDQAFEQAVRASWPVTREWKYLCTACGDYGLEMHDCPGDATCGRPNEHLPHDYGTPCWCSAGGRFRQQPRSEVDDLAKASQQPRKPSRFGGR